MLHREEDVKAADDRDMEVEMVGLLGQSTDQQETHQKPMGHERIRVLVMSIMAAAFTVLSLLGFFLVQNTAQEEGIDKYHNMSLKERQVQNYIDGTALMLNIHITHHAGTVFCIKMRLVGLAPEFACMGGKLWPSNETKHLPIPWKYNDTEFMVKRIRPHFHMISWEFMYWANLQNTTNWEYEDLLSVIIMRDPIDRFMAGGKCSTIGEIDDPTNETQHLWWEYANEECADNYALRVLAPDNGCCNGANTSEHYVEGAKNLLRRFTFILDQACLNESIEALAHKLNISVDLSGDSGYHRVHKPARERLANDTLYEYLQHRFRRDIELYEWAKSKSILDCSQLKK